VDYKDYYAILGVPKSASAGDIKKAFRKLAREHHPDRNPGDKSAEQRFKDVNEAHAVLSDTEKRQRYDMFGPEMAAAGGAYAGHNPFAGFAGGRGAGGAPGGIRWEFRSTGSPGDADAGGFSDFFRMMFGEAGPAAGTGSRRTRPATDPALADLFEQVSRPGATTRQRPPEPVGDAEATADLTLEEAFAGTSRVVEYEGKRYQVTIPKGVDTGSRVKLSGKGPGGRDLVVRVRMLPHATFTRKGNDLERELPVTLGEALLGAEVPVTTLKGRILLTIPAGTQPGKTFRLTGQGMPRLKGDGSGDLYVKTRVLLPTHLDADTRAAAQRFIELARQPDPRSHTARTQTKAS
jgi:curved DNA-binding protein